MNLKNIFSTVIVSVLSFIGSARADITSGLVLYLPLNETSGLTASDASGLGNNGTLINFSGDNSYWTNGWLNGGLQIGGTTTPVTNYVSIPDSPSLNFNNTNAVNTTSNVFTLAVWAKVPTIQTAGGAILAKGTGGNEQYDIDINPATTAARYRIVLRNNANAAVTLSSTVAPNNAWTHVVVTVDARNTASQTIRMYINGISNNTATSTVLGTLKAGSNPVAVGARQQAAAAYNFAITNSTVDEVRIYNRILSPSDVFELYQLGGFGNTNGSIPTITTQPRNVTNYVGDVAAFTVGATGTTPFFYQWFSNNVAIPNQTNVTLVLTNVQLSWSAAYSVQVTNIIGATNSTAAFLQVQPLPAANITANLVGYWKFDDGSGSSTAADSSGNGNPGTLTGFADLSAAWVTGITNGALNFNADSSGAQVVAIPAVGTPGPAVLDFSANPALTLAAWVNASNSLVQSNGAAIFCRGTGGGGEQYTLDLPTAGYRFYVRNGSNTSIAVNTTIRPNGTWQHIVAAFDAINGIQNVYINGQLVNITVAPTSLTTNGNSHEVTIGSRQSAAAAYNLPFTGAIDDARIYSRALTSADVQALYLAGGVYPPTFATQPQGGSRYVGDDVTLSAVVAGTAPIAYQWRKNATNIVGATNLSLIFTNLQLTNAGTYTLFVSNGYGTNLSAPAVLQVSSFVLTNSLAAYWKFDEGSGSTAVDSSTNANNGFLVGSDYRWVAGRIGGALNVNTLGSLNTYVSVPDSPSLNFDTSLQFSLTAWVRGSGTQVSGAGIIAKGTGGGGEQYALDVQSGVIRFFVRNAAAVASALASTVPPSGTWQHVVATYDGSTGAMRLYVNGLLVGSLTGPTALLANTGHEVSIGNRQSGSAAYNFPFAGMIDDVRIYTRALNASDVQQLYSSAGPFAPVIYSFSPTNGALLAGDNVTFSASADGDAPLSYQWLKNGTNIPNATNLTYTLNNIQTSDSGNYTFLVSNGTSASTNVVVSVQAVPAPALTSSLVAYWTFDETTGTAVADSSGNGNSMTLYNFAGDNSQWGAGRIGGALHLNANGSVSNQFGGVDQPLTLQNGDRFSFSFWAKLDPGPHGTNPRFITPQLTHWVLWTPGRGVGFFTPTNSTEPSSNSWTHYVVAFDRVAGTYTLYVNGAREAANVGPYSKGDPTTSLWLIGHSESTVPATTDVDSWTGFLDDMRVYNRLLNVNDVRALYYSAGGQPALSITQNGNNVVLSWSSAATGFNLQSTDVLGTGWTNVAGTPTASDDGLTQSITVAASGNAKFYRLQK